MNPRGRTTVTGSGSLAGLALTSIVLIAACTSTHPRSDGTTNPPSAPAARYLAIATIGNRSLEHDFDALEDHDHDQLAAATADLRDAAATERRFDRSLLAIALPPAMETTARALVRVNESRAALTAQAAASTSLPQLLRLDQQAAAANGPVEQQVKTLRHQLGLPPPDAS